jgi:hypothetical protein
LSGQHWATPSFCWQVEPRGQSVVVMQALPQNFWLRLGSSTQLSPWPPHSVFAPQGSQNVLSVRQARMEGSQYSPIAHSVSERQPAISSTHWPVKLLQYFGMAPSIAPMRHESSERHTHWRRTLSHRS